MFSLCKVHHPPVTVLLGTNISHIVFFFRLMNLYSALTAREPLLNIENNNINIKFIF